MVKQLKLDPKDLKVFISPHMCIIHPSSYIFIFFIIIMHLSSSSPRGGDPGAVGGGIGDFVGTWKHICAPVVREMKGLCFITPQTTEKYGDLASAKVQGNCEQAFIVCSQRTLGNVQMSKLWKKLNK